MKRFFILLTLYWLVGSITILRAQPQQPPVGNFTPRDYGDNQPPENYSICKDDRGFIYSGNVGGVLQYDGHNWQFIKVVTGNKINALCYAGNNTIATGGLNYFGVIYPDKNGKLSFHSLKDLLPEDFGPFEIITIHELKGEIFFQSENGIFIYNQKGNLKVIKPEHSFFRGYLADGRYFVRDRHHGLMEWKKNKMASFANDSISKDYGFFGIVNFDTDHFLAATHDLGFYTLHKKTGEIQMYSSFFYDDFLPLIYGIEKLDHGLFALATINHGVIILDKDLELRTRISRNDGLKSSFINQICTDNSGNIWAATSGGVSFIDIHSPLHFFSEISGLPGNVEDVHCIGTHYYAGSSAGLFLLPQAYTDDQRPWRKIETVNSQVYDLDVNEKDVLVASGNGLYAGTLNSFKKIKEGNYQSVRFIRGINRIIALTPDNIEVYDNNYRLMEILELPVHVQRSHSIEFDTSQQGRIRVWIGLSQQGVLRLDFSGDKTFLDLFNENDGLMPGVVKPCNFLGKIIFLTENGLQHFISEEEVAKSLSEDQKNDPAFNRGYFDSFKIPEKNISGKVAALVVDKGRIYLALDDKLCYFDERGRKHQREFSALKMGRINELICINNQLWISAAEGIALFNPNHFKKLDLSFRLYFRKISADDNEILMEEYFGSEHAFHVSQVERSVQLDYSDNSLYFVFASDYFDLNNSIEYSWYLEGTDTKWSSWSRNNAVTLNNLHEGTYVFHVKARNIYGTESKEATFYFHVLPPWYRTWWAYVLYLIIAIAIIYLAIRISVYRLKQSNIRLENIVKERTQEIATKNEELKAQNHQILHQKQEITDSINYAKRIQEAILPIKKEIQRVFPDSFVLFKPKDIVSGDFYWFAHRDKQSIFICADCTGHGVPGAFMSMICTDRLNHTVLEKKISTPSAMLREVNQGIKRSLKQEDESELKTKDGMDAAVCSFNHSTMELTYAGANRPLWLLRDGEITEYKPTKTAVGGFTPEDQHFEEVKIPILKNDIVYLSTDGYADQFGGPKGKKLMVKSFKELLIKVSVHSFEKQHRDLDEYIENWRNFTNETNNYIEQVDDMCVMGIKF